ncbi:MAG: hypothetical protein U9Q68_05265, partial [Euryarchaeota archaeon]|nr:hypothetical protein [Euryarchaeota archaeon]
VYQLSGLNVEEKIFAKRLCGAYVIDAGEAEAIALCLSGKYGLFFTDDSGTRDVDDSIISKSMIRQA